MSPDASIPEQLDLTPVPQKGEQEDREGERQGLLAAALGGQDDTLDKRVAIILNHYPETRDSDVKLQLRYWEVFEDYDGGPIEPADLFVMARLTSLARSRAKLQNTYGLFQASADVRRQRKKLSHEEYQKALEAAPRFPMYAVYVDESGKNSPNVIVAGVWFALGEETLRVTKRLTQWRIENSFDAEFHFKDIDDAVEPAYREVLELFLGEATSVSFKAVSVPHAGLKRVDEAIENLCHYLLVEGVQHEHASGRAPLPRTLQVWKDLEEEGRDKLMMARLKERVQSASVARFGGQLATDEFGAMDSRGFDLVQIADLFAGSLNRRLNRGGGRPNAKSRFAEYLLERVGMPEGPVGAAAIGDLAIHVTL